MSTECRTAARGSRRGGDSGDGGGVVRACAACLIPRPQKKRALPRPRQTPLNSLCYACEWQHPRAYPFTMASAALAFFSLFFVPWRRGRVGGGAM